MSGPDPLVVGNELAVADRPHPGQIGNHLDPAADHTRVHRIIVAVQANVVIARQPTRGPPPGRRRHRRQRQHSGLVGGDPLGRGAAQRPPRPSVHHRQPRLELGVERRRRTKVPARQHRQQPSRVGGDHGQHRQLGRFAGLPEPDRQRDRREPQVALGDLARRIGGARGRVRRQIHRPQLGHPSRQHPDRVGPADPLGDHRRRHRRIHPQQLPDPRLHFVHNGPCWLPLVLRRRLRSQRRPHRVPRDPQHPGDRLDRHAF